MGRLSTALAASLMVIGTTMAAASVAPASAEPNIQPAGSMPIPEGPAPSWIIADLDTGQVLAGRDMYGAHPPASTIKTLLALTALDELGLDATVVASPANARVECNCAGIKAGHTYTVRQLLDGILLVSGNDAANTLADMLGGYDIAVDKMNVKAAAIGATNTHATSPSGLDGPGGPGWTTPHDLAAIFRAAMANPVFAQITAQPTAMFPTGSGERPLINQDELLVRYPGAIGGKTGYTNAARKTFVGAADRNGRRLVIAMMYGLVREGGPTYWDQAATLLDWGFAQNPSQSVATL
ncbi:D-alanyl-D-alanine carboxypeptidase family protein [Mycolicibacterium sp.]|uniref:D-alanyl-D-alanine carboxypeptidase family protein n=1 Tax=Mycolicibacterium sp. TaxID=2320850 RepID=UPI001DEA3E9B|nr:D-alanyl-D-alanine carboxypeptidase family protein [Mycolicibacterium sp.]MCB1290480.1 D-alanyl-D-alanine carboxypeptidase [Mycobacterium sp.]MCB9408516.1 D-alanyl-D-alanine carboxypeptidase [Mycolicibacterium sp.]